jgi:hypothetical protein
MILAFIKQLHKCSVNEDIFINQCCFCHKKVISANIAIRMPVQGQKTAAKAINGKDIRFHEGLYYLGN